MPFFQKKRPGLSQDGSLDFRELTDATYFLENHPDAVYTLDLEGHIVSYNQKLALLLGYPDHTLSTKHFSTFIHPSEAVRIAPFKERALQGETVHFTAQVRHQDGHLLTMNVTNIPIYKNHLIIGLYGIARDISQHVHLRKQHIRFTQKERLAESKAPVAFLDYLPLTEEWFFSKDFTALLTISAHRLSNMEIEEFLLEIHPDDQILFKTTLKQLATQEHAMSIQLRMNRQENHQRLLRCESISSYADDGMFVSMMFYEVTRSTHPQHNPSGSVFSTVETVVYEYNEIEQTFTFLTEGFLHHYPDYLKRLETDPAFWQELLHPDDLRHVATVLKDHDPHDTIRLTYRMHLKDTWRWFEEIRLPRREQNSTRYTGYQGIVTDITHVKQQQDEIIRLSQCHPMTGLPNQAALLGEIEYSLATQQPICLIAIEFNQFYKINLQLGYRFGEQWLLDTQDALKEQLPDVYCAHLDGDRYMALLPELFNEEELKKRCLHLLELAKRRFWIDDFEFIPPLAIGVSSYENGDNMTPAELLDTANTALARAKRQKRPAYEFYTSKLNLEIYRRHQLEQGLRYAIERDELFLEFQPTVNIWSGKIITFEALVRWEHSEWGFVPPQDFIPLAEEGRCYRPINDWVLDTVCQTLNRLIKQSLPVVPISINLSPKRLLQTDFIESVTDCLARHDVQAKHLRFELSESAFTEDNAVLTENILALKKLGIPLILDRYGIGQVSLGCLRDYPITSLKLDHSFVAQLEQQKQPDALLKSILYFAKELQVTVVAEGVETVHQLELFRSAECHAVQGYLFSRPVAEQDLPKLLRLGTLIPSETLKVSPKKPLPSLHGQVTITRLNGKEVHVGASPILITRSTNRSVHFYSSVRLPVNHQIELSLQLKDVTHPETIVEPLTITELDNGLFHYSADYKVRAQSVHLMKALEHSQQEKLDDFFMLG
ncbi:EAL domain-containing protein [Exiguobacterium sp. s193]|uniref:EAL domain-containing protein n=1 Tax=Exiguobacterium sp. s193 TaxID=2751207 RepID=UPI002037321F|nr:EAL domain-containing protein [Exiguobacterium sp. s193]